MKRLMYILLGTLLIVSLYSCREDLCYGHNHGKTVNFFVDWIQDFDIYWSEDWRDKYNNSFEIDWNKLAISEPEGVRAVIYPWSEDKGKIIRNMPSSGGQVILNHGYYDCLLYNNDTEFIQFDDTDNAALSTATTRSRNVVSFSMTMDKLEENVVNQPDMLFSAAVDSLQIEYNEFNLNDVESTVEKFKDLDITMYPLVHTYVLRFNIESGMKYVAVARGMLKNMAGTVNMMTGKTLSDMVSLEFEEYTKDEGGITAYIKSFGLCNYNPGFGNREARGFYDNTSESRSDRPRSTGNEKNTLTIQLALESGKIKTVEFDVTEELRKQPRGGILTVGGIVITAEEGAGPSGNFGVNLNPWNTEDNFIYMEREDN